MDLDLLKTWKDIKDLPEVQAIYSEGAVDANKLPWDVRAALGDFLCSTTFDKTSAQQKSKFLDEMSEKLQESGSSTALDQWSAMAKLKSRDASGTLRKHTKTSIYEVIKTAVEAERELVEKPDADEPQLELEESMQVDEQDLSEASESSSEASAAQIMIKVEPDYDDEDDDVMDEDEVEFASPSKVPTCAQNLFETLETLS